jgi:hypothetical protein
MVGNVVALLAASVDSSRDPPIGEAFETRLRKTTACSLMENTILSVNSKQILIMMNHYIIKHI